MRWVKFLAVFVLMTLLLSVVPGVVRAEGPAGKDHLTASEMANATLASNLNGIAPSGIRGVALSSGQVGYSEVYRLEGCDPAVASDSAPCYFVVAAGRDVVSRPAVRKASPLSSESILTCGKNIYNGAGALVYTLQENVDVTFWNQWGKAPVTMNWGNLDGTQTYLIGTSWNSLSGPNPSPGWGTYTNTAYASASGNLVYWPNLSYYYSVLMTINTNGWYCQ